jgi:ABC-2 type transport system permease protein
MNAPVRVNLGIMQVEPKPEQYNKTNQAIAVLLEGTFESLYKNRIPPEIQNSPDIKFRDKSDTTKMIFISDGDVIRNGITRSGGIMPVGYDRYTNTFYGNKNFILNCIDYLCDDSGLITVRSKELKLRMLDKKIVHDNLLILKLANVSMPLAVIILFGLIKSRNRKRKYGRKNSERKQEAVLSPLSSARNE